MSLINICSALFATAIIYMFFTKLSECKRWVKFMLAYVYLRWVNKKPPLFNFDAYSHDLGQIGIVPLPRARLCENPRKLSSHQHAIDSIEISGQNKCGHALSMQLSRRHDRRTEVSLYFRLSNGDEYQLPIQPATNVYNTDGESFSAAGLFLEVQEPLRNWRINFNGHLRKTFPKVDNDDDIVLAKFNLIWSPLSNYVSYPEDYQPNYVADYLSRQSRVSPVEFFNKLSTEWYEQFGQLKGTVSLNGDKEIHLLLRGLKKRTHGYDQLVKIKQRFSIEGVLHNGTFLHVFVENVSNGLKKFISGYVCPPCNTIVHHINQCQLNITHICDDNFRPGSLNFDFTAGNALYKLRVDIRDYKCQLHIGQKNELSNTIYGCYVTLNDKPGDGILRFCHRNHKIYSHSHSLSSFPLLCETNIRETDKMVVTFDEEECQSDHLVGGKGASLSLLSKLQIMQPKFIVPAGFCMTKRAFEIHLKQNNHLQKAIENLQKISCSTGTPGELPEQCQKLVELINNTKVSDKLRHQLELILQQISGSGYQQRRYAVRSSAIGEDGLDLSAAGQNETFLGVTGLEQICTCVVRCWASQFSFRSVEYQRQNGQLLNRGMAVVIQEMVAAEVAGVLFSRDPVTGSPNKLFIASDYGLGESVVSASVDPDTIVINRSWDDRLSLHHIQIGSKQLQINMSENTGTVEVETADTSKCSLPEEMAIKLGQLAVHLEKCFGSSRDIEWAIKHDQIYLLQCRPVTTDNPVTDYEIFHEFDSGSKTDWEAYTKANIGEVCPGAMMPLTITSLLRFNHQYFNKGFTWKLDISKYDPTPNDNTAAIFRNSVFFDMISQKAWSLEKEKSEAAKAVEIGYYGRILDDDDVNEMALERYSIRPNIWHQSKCIRLMLNGMTIGKWMLHKYFKMFENYPVPTEGLTDPLDCLNAIAKAFVPHNTVSHIHFSITMASSMWNLLLLKTLSSGEITSDNYADLAMLVGHNGAESGTVPSGLEELAVIISKVTDARAFSNMTTEDALNWLQTNATEANTKFKEFLRRHGHRGFKEFLLECITWREDPRPLVKALQKMLQAGTPKAKAKVETAQLIEQIKMPLNPFKKFLLKYLVLNGCRMGVCNREKSKSLIIKYTDIIRQGYKHLGQVMVERGYFTDPQLVMFFTQDELHQLIETRSPKLLRRAKHRQRLHDIMDQYRYPEITRGEPVPINPSNDHVQAVTSKVQIKGFPVCQGSVQAPARVVIDMKDAHTIQAGEILITIGTDIGWSPYFPLLSGVITELGGLISHGAVVARECGLPCIVGVVNATKLFQTGDIIHLNANDGIITKMEVN